MFRAVLVFVVVSILFSISSASGASTLLLRDGGVVKGELLNPGEINRRTYRVKTVEGLEITLDARLVEGIQVRERDALIEYNRDAPLTSNTVENHLYWARWCAERQLSEQARLHWRQILELDPEHVDARQILGYTRTTSGDWECILGRQQRRGLVQYRGGLRTAQEIEVMNFLERQAQARQDWASTVRGLIRRLPNPQAEAELLAIRDPAAVVPIGNILEDRRNPPNPHTRMVLLRTLAQIQDVAAIQAVAAWSVRIEETEEIRRRCIEELQRRINEQPEVRQIVVAVYRDILRRAAARNPVDQLAVGLMTIIAEALGIIGGHEAVPDLIEVLVVRVTEVHREEAQGHAFGPGAPGGMQIGQVRRVNTFQLPNQTVLSTLRRLTGVNFEFNQDAWRNWYRQHYRSPTQNLRRS